MKASLLVGFTAGMLGMYQAPPIFKVGSDLVRLDVSVLDKDRRPVHGLKAVDFTVAEGGKTQAITAFTEVETPGTAATPADVPWRSAASPDVVSNVHGSDGRLVVIIFDGAISFTGQVHAREVARAVVNNLGQDDLAGLVFTSRFGNAGIPQNLTNDRHLLLEAIERPFAVDAGGGPGCGTGIDWLEQLGKIVQSLREQPRRRKVLIIVTPSYSLEGGMACPTLTDAAQRFVRQLALANVAVHVVDPTGLDTDMGNRNPLAGAMRQARLNGLRFLPDKTGGRTIINTNTPEEKVSGILDETSAYYLIGFVPADPQHPQRIDVKVKRKGLTVRAPTGYANAPTPAAASSTPLVNAVSRLLPDMGFPMTLSAVPFAAAGSASPVLSLIVGVPADLMVPLAGASADTPRGPQSAKLMVLALDPKARPVGDPYEATLSQEVFGAQPAAGSREIRAALALKPGRYELRVAIETTSGRTGSVYTYVEVPDFAGAPLSLSGLVMSATPASPSTALTPAANFLPVTPTLRRTFVQSDDVVAYARVYREPGKPPVPLSATARILDARGATRMDRAIDMKADEWAAGAADLSVHLPLKELSPGECLLILSVSAGEHTAERRVPFTVR